MTAEAQVRQRLAPFVVVDTADLPRVDWLNYRRRGIGGSDVAAILGVSPVRTARDIYYDKLGVVALEPDESNWVQLEVGHLLEDLVAQIFQKKTGYRVFQIKKMFHHPEYPYLLADVDYFVELPDGKIALLEIKTTNYNAKDHWWLDGREIVPVYYELQGRHYMAITDIDRVFFCCLYGNTEDEVIIREIKRDMDYEAELIIHEQHYWTGFVQTKTPPPYVEDGDLVMDSVLQHLAQADPNEEAITLDMTHINCLLQYLQLQQEKSKLDAQSRKLEAAMKRLRGRIVSVMGASCTAVGNHNGMNYTVTFNPVRKPVVDKDSLLRLQLNHPDIYNQYVSTSEYRKFHVKAKEWSAA